MAVAILCISTSRIKSNFLDFCSFGRSSLRTAGFILVALSVDILTGYLFDLPLVS
jgi:hypothetical protein